MVKYQTLSEFLRCPFGNTNSLNKVKEYEERYRNDSSKLRIEGFMESSGAYYIHVRVPSETNSDTNYAYDVIIRFFTDDTQIAKQNSLNEYYIQFFSNSPGFIYKYAALYKREGYLIDLLYNKMDPEYKNTMPEKANEKMELSFDKSIFFACKYLSGMKFGVLNKAGILLQRKKSPSKFFADISSFRSVKFDRELMEADRKLHQGLISKKNADKRKNDIHRNMSKTSTTKKSSTGTPVTHSIQRIQKIGGKSKVTKKVARKSTSH